MDASRKDLGADASQDAPNAPKLGSVATTLKIVAVAFAVACVAMLVCNLSVSAARCKHKEALTDADRKQRYRRCTSAYFFGGRDSYASANANETLNGLASVTVVFALGAACFGGLVLFQKRLGEAAAQPAAKVNVDIKPIDEMNSLRSLLV